MPKVPPRLASHLVAAGVTIPFAVWIAVSDIRGVLPTTAWLLPLAAAYYLGLRIGREVVRGARRAGDDDPGGRWMTTKEPGAEDEETSESFTRDREET